MLSGQKESIFVDNDMRALAETIEGLKVLRRKRITTVGDGHCIM